MILYHFFFQAVLHENDTMVFKGHFEDGIAAWGNVSMSKIMNVGINEFPLRLEFETPHPPQKQCGPGNHTNQHRASSSASCRILGSPTVAVVDAPNSYHGAVNEITLSLSELFGKLSKQNFLQRVLESVRLRNLALQQAAPSNDSFRAASLSREKESQHSALTRPWDHDEKCRNVSYVTPASQGKIG